MYSIQGYRCHFIQIPDQELEKRRSSFKVNPADQKLYVTNLKCKDQNTKGSLEVEDSEDNDDDDDEDERSENETEDDIFEQDIVS